MLFQAKKLVSRYAPKPVYRGLATIYRQYKRILEFVHARGLGDVGRLYPAEWHTHMTGEKWQSDAHIIGRALREEFAPDSVIDLGCGVGLHLQHFEQNGTEIHGVDGANGAKENALISRSNFEIADLREPYYPPHPFDLVICFEVAEHLPEQFADTLVDSIIRCGDTIAFTAAEPGQGGTHHLNEKPREYWIEKFEKRGYSFDDKATERLRRNMDEVNKTTWIPKNLMIFYPE